MTDKYICMRCKSADAKTSVPYKIIENRDGESIRFKGQLCERCFKELFEDKENVEKKKEEINGKVQE